MAKHEFGIMAIPPEQNKRYDEYEPFKYNCITVNDEYLEKVLCDLSDICCYWHTLEEKGRGLAYCGITLISPDVLNGFAEVIHNTEGLFDLEKLCEKAMVENKWMIHFGL